MDVFLGEYSIRRRGKKEGADVWQTFLWFLDAALKTFGFLIGLIVYITERPCVVAF